MITTTVTGLRANLKKFIDYVIENRHEVIVNRGDSAVVLMSLEDYNAIVETEYLASSKTMTRVIMQGIKDADSGNYKEVDVNAL